LVTVQPDPREYMMVAVPTDIPLTTPEEEPIVAMPVLPLLHEPPLPAVTPRVLVPPIQTCAVPVIVPGVVFTVTGFVARQPVAGVNVMVAVPAAIPDTAPIVLTEAIPGVPELHVPLTAPTLNKPVLPTHKADMPLIVGAVFTVMVFVTLQAAMPAPSE
jgi:hypothetical protein